MQAQVQTSDHAPARVDLLVVGAGIAGLLAAHRALRLRPGISVLIVDKGLALEERRAQTASRLEGYGGAGLYLGGRLYLGPTTLPILPPVTPPPEMRPILEGEAYMACSAEVNALFTALGITAPVLPAPAGALAEAVARAADVGLEYLTSYPSRVPTVEERFAVLARLGRMLRDAGARFAFGTRVGALRRTGEGYLAELRPTAPEASDAGATASAVAARAVVLAPGRYGAEWLLGAAGALGVRVVPLPAAFGVRIEVPAAVYDPLTTTYPDPRLQLRLADDAVLKTYATCPGGVVLPVMRYGRLVASGVPRFGNERGPNTTLAILAQPGVEGAAVRWSGGGDVAAALNARAPGRLVVQRLRDVRERRATTAADLAANAVRPSCAEVTPAALHDALPSVYWEALDDFLARLDRLAPGVDSPDTLVYGPAEERFWHFPTDEHVQTDAPGLFVAGDATGQSQGVIQAGIAGLLAGAGVADYLGARGSEINPSASIASQPR